MKKKVIFPLTFLLTLMAVQPAMANQTPGPYVLLSELLILPAMVILTLMGGGYLIMNRLRPKKSRVRKLLFIIGMVVVFLVSGMHEAVGVVIAFIFGIIALRRGFRMISWGREARPVINAPGHLTEANPWRLIPAGGLLIASTIFLIGMAIAFFGYFPEIALENKETGLKKFVAHQLAYARLAKSEKGEIRYHKITNNDPEYKSFFSGSPFFYDRPTVHFNYSADEKYFTVYVLPAKFPLFPYNYLTSRPSYRADETGQIRMIRVHEQNVLCPPDAPVVLKVEEEDIKKAMHEMLNNKES